MEDKEELRNIFINLLSSIKGEYYTLRSKIIGELLDSFVKKQRWRKVGVYAPKDWEVNLWFLWKEWLKDGFFLFFPRIDGNKLSYVKVKDIEGELSRGSFGIMEPSGEHRVSLNDIEVFILPGVAFDRRGVRLGRGGGYIDRTLKGVSSVKIGVAFSFQVIDFIPYSSTDVKMDFIINDKEIIRARGG